MRRNPFIKRKSVIDGRRMRISMQFFAEDDAGDSSGSGEAPVDQDGSGAGDKPDDKPDISPDIQKLIDAAAAQQSADKDKSIKKLEAELDKLRKANMTAEELKKLEIKQKEEELAAKTAEITVKENKLFAIQELGASSLSAHTLEVVDFVLAPTQDEIKTKVKALSGLLDKLVKDEVDAAFRKNGRNPNNPSNSDNGGNAHNAFAEQLGKIRADKAKQSTDVLNYYTGGKK